MPSDSQNRCTVCRRRIGWNLPGCFDHPAAEATRGIGGRPTVYTYEQRDRVLVMLEVDGLSRAEVAQRTKMSLTTVAAIQRESQQKALQRRLDRERRRVA